MQTAHDVFTLYLWLAMMLAFVSFFCPWWLVLLIKACWTVALFITIIVVAKRWDREHPEE